MTKVEELRDDLDQLIETEASKVLTANQFLPLPGFDGIMDAIVAASHAEGVAEEREKLVHCKQCVFGLPDGNPAHDYVRTCIEAAGHKRIVDANDYCMFAELGNAPVLAPTKEGEKSYYGGQSATSSGDHWEQKLIHGPEMTGKP